jgi:hypothetical protein
MFSAFVGRLIHLRQSICTAQCGYWRVWDGLQPTQSPTYEAGYPEFTCSCDQPRVGSGASACSFVKERSEGNLEKKSVGTELAVALEKGLFRRVRKLAKSYCQQSLRPSAWNKSALTERVFMIFDIWVFFRKSDGKFQDSLKQDKDNGYFIWGRM